MSLTLTTEVTNDCHVSYSDEVTRKKVDLKAIRELVGGAEINTCTTLLRIFVKDKTIKNFKKWSRE